MAKLKSRKGVAAKATHTQERLRLRLLLWEPLKLKLAAHFALSPTGEQSRMARTLGIAPSQLHRFSCPKCEHNQEPSFSIGTAILLYLQQQQQHQTIETKPHEITTHQDHPQYQKANRRSHPR